ncbi:MAG TPA: hypothetical protein VIK35_04695 [Verrucomicrobiae bacterium]
MKNEIHSTDPVSVHARAVKAKNNVSSGKITTDKSVAASFAVETGIVRRKRKLWLKEKPERIKMKTKMKGKKAPPLSMLLVK